MALHPVLYLALLTLEPLAGPGPELPGTSLDSLVAAEKAFAALSAQKGMDAAFLAFLADDAVLLRPAPVNGKTWFRDHSGAPVKLRWEPDFALLAEAGDLGFTSGPFEVRDTSKPANPPSYGDFVSAWKRQSDRSWKVVFDQGASHPESTFVNAGRVRRLTPFRLAERLADTTGARGELLHIDSTYRQGAPGEAAARIPGFLDPEVRFFRPGALPLEGRVAVERLIRTSPGMQERRPLLADVSASNDLGYTYGGYRNGANDAAHTDRGYYFTIWRRSARGAWRVLIDVEARPLRQ